MNAARAAKAPHSQAATPSNTAQNAIQPSLGNRNNAERNTASRTPAVITRVLSMSARAFPPAGQRAAAHQLQQSLQQIPAAAIVGGNGESEPRIARGELLGAVRELDHARPEGRDIADYLQAHLVLMQPLGFLLQGSHEQLLQRRNLFGGSPPVLRAEGEQGQVFDAAIGARTRDLTHRLDSLLVTGDAREIALFGPAPVAIHDDVDMPADVVGGRDL